MKRIKYLGVLLSIVTLCVACEKSEKDGLGGFHKNFVEFIIAKFICTDCKIQMCIFS